MKAIGELTLAEAQLEAALAEGPCPKANSTLADRCYDGRITVTERTGLTDIEQYEDSCDTCKGTGRVPLLPGLRKPCTGGAQLQLSALEVADKMFEEALAYGLHSNPHLKDIHWENLHDAVAEYSQVRFGHSHLNHAFPNLGHAINCTGCQGRGWVPETDEFAVLAGIPLGGRLEVMSYWKWCQQDHHILLTNQSADTLRLAFWTPTGRAFQGLQERSIVQLGKDGFKLLDDGRRLNSCAEGDMLSRSHGKPNPSRWSGGVGVDSTHVPVLFRTSVPGMDESVKTFWCINVTNSLGVSTNRDQSYSVCGVRQIARSRRPTNLTAVPAPRYNAKGTSAMGFLSKADGDWTSKLIPVGFVSTSGLVCIQGCFRLGGHLVPVTGICALPPVLLSEDLLRLQATMPSILDYAQPYARKLKIVLDTYPLAQFLVLNPINRRESIKQAPLAWFSTPVHQPIRIGSIDTVGRRIQRQRNLDGG